MKQIKQIVILILYMVTNITIAMEGKLENCQHCKTIIHPSSHGTTGFWITDKIPHKNWKCTKVEDTYPNTDVCTMCKQGKIRYFHWMRHEKLDFPISVDAHCAGMMEGDPEAARKREDMLHVRSTKRAEWCNLQLWNTKTVTRNIHGTTFKETLVEEATIEAALGNDYKTHKVVIKLGGTNLHPKYYIHKIDKDTRKTSLLHETLDEAKLSAFDYLWPLEIK